MVKYRLKSSGINLSLAGNIFLTKAKRKVETPHNNKRTPIAANIFTQYLYFYSLSITSFGIYSNKVIRR